MSELVVNVLRAGIVESRHYGDVVIVDPQGHVIYSLGNPNRITFARSAAKPLQALPMLESGAADAFGFQQSHLAISCASHEGETFHTAVVEEMLQRIGLQVSDLQCGVHPPYRSESYEALRAAGQRPTPLHNNCSGKHAGMLATAVHLKEDIGGYLEPNHPVQQRILSTVSEMCGIAKADIQIGTDGCGTPVYALPLRNLAMAFARLASPGSLHQPRAAAARRLVSAMMECPELVGGTDRFCTQLTSVGNGTLVGKLGAEAVYCVGLLEKGWGLCVKIDDGSDRAVSPTVVEALLQCGGIVSDLANRLRTFHRPVLRNRSNEVVGEILPCFQLRS